MPNSTKQPDNSVKPTFPDLFGYEMRKREVPPEHIQSAFDALGATEDKAFPKAGPKPKGRPKREAERKLWVTDMFYYEMLERKIPHEITVSVFDAVVAAKDWLRNYKAVRSKREVEESKKMLDAFYKSMKKAFPRVDGEVLSNALKDGGALKKKLLDFHRSVLTDASAKYHFLLTTPSGKLSIESSKDADKQWRGRSPLICRRGNGGLALTVEEIEEEWANYPDCLELALDSDVWGMKRAAAEVVRKGLQPAPGARGFP